MNCPKCGTMLKYVFNMMTICPKCDYGGHPHTPATKKEIKNKCDIVESTWGIYALVNDADCHIVYYPIGLSPQLKEYKFLVHTQEDMYNYFYFTKKEAVMLLDMLNNVEDIAKGSTFFLSMDGCCSTFTYMGGNDFRFSGPQGKIDITHKKKLIDFLKESCK